MMNQTQNRTGQRQETDRNYVNILGIKNLSTTINSLLVSVRENITHSKQFYIVTPNPELVLASTKNPDLKLALNSANFSVPDGVGLNFASKVLYGHLINIIPGRILFERLIEVANRLGWKVFFLGGTGIEAKRAAESININYQNIKIETFSGPHLNNFGLPATEIDKNLQQKSIQLINKFSPQLLFVAFGNPKQEIWIYKNLKSLNVGGAMAVGGTFRYFAGLSPLPPKWMADLGLEWLYRLITEPRRVGRIINATVIFPLRVIWFKISGK
jgi:N-acetylglucosaminyldiphosphoundecaprenol N-acetyl-beta-D-mannosaminyltransferase